MIKLKHSALVLAVAAAVVTAGIGFTVVSAATSSNDGLVDKLATKFNLNKDDVQKVFDENRAEKQAERMAEVESDLQSEVDQGELSAEQKDKIVAKLKELQSTRQAERTELETWAEQNGLDLQTIMLGKRGMHRGDHPNLQALVDKGKITTEQKALIEQKQSELQTKRQEEVAELREWAQQNDIDMQYLKPLGGRGHGGMHKFDMMQ